MPLLFRASHDTGKSAADQVQLQMPTLTRQTELCLLQDCRGLLLSSRVLFQRQPMQRLCRTSLAKPVASWHARSAKSRIRFLAARSQRRMDAGNGEHPNSTTFSPQNTSGSPWILVRTRDSTFAPTLGFAPYSWARMMSDCRLIFRVIPSMRSYVCHFVVSSLSLLQYVQRACKCTVL